VKVEAAALLAEAEAGVPPAALTGALPLPTAAPSQDNLKAVNRAKLVFEQLSISIQAELDNPEQRMTWMWRQTMGWMWAFIQTTLIPGLIDAIGFWYFYHTLFKPLPISSVGKTKCYHTCHRRDHHHQRANIHQGNDMIYGGHPLYEIHSKPIFYHHLLKRESCL
jgi:hypothetical protein